ncbi:MAG: hypothetical protein ACJ71W_16300 [Terriglobales bacterium]
MRFCLGKQIGDVLADGIGFPHGCLDDNEMVEEPGMLSEPRRKLCRSFFACIFLLTSLLCPAQLPDQQEIPSLRTQSNIVFVPTLVKDKAGKLVFGLQPKDFIIEDDGVEQQVSMDEAEPQEAVSLVIAIQIGRTAVHEFQRMEGLSRLLD